MTLPLRLALFVVGPPFTEVRNRWHAFQVAANRLFGAAARPDLLLARKGNVVVSCIDT
jgi:hypothetical protein